MTTAVDVEAERLDRHAGAELEGGFAIEDVKPDAASSLAGADAGHVPEASCARSPLRECKLD